MMTIEEKANAEIDRLNREIAMANLERVRWRRLAQQYAGKPDVWPDTLTTPHPPTAQDHGTFILHVPER